MSRQKTITKTTAEEKGRRFLPNNAVTSAAWEWMESLMQQGNSASLSLPQGTTGTNEACRGKLGWFGCLRGKAAILAGLVQQMGRDRIASHRCKDHEQGCAKKLGPGCEKSSARLEPAQDGHARLVLNETVTFLHTTLYTKVKLPQKRCFKNLPYGQFLPAVRA